MDTNMTGRLVIVKQLFVDGGFVGSNRTQRRLRSRALVVKLEYSIGPKIRGFGILTEQAARASARAGVRTKGTGLANRAGRDDVPIPRNAAGTGVNSPFAIAEIAERRA